MKKVIIGVMLLGSVSNLFSQQTTPLPSSAKQQYLQTSKNQKTAAWVLLGTGVPLFIIAGANSLDHLFESTPTSDALAVVGIAASLGSIPLFIAAHRNKKKAMSAAAFLKLEQSTSFTRVGPGMHSFAAVAIRIIH